MRSKWSLFISPNASLTDEAKELYRRAAACQRDFANGQSFLHEVFALYHSSAAAANCRIPIKPIYDPLCEVVWRLLVSLNFHAPVPPPPEPVFVGFAEEKDRLRDYISSLKSRFRGIELPQAPRARIIESLSAALLAFSRALPESLLRPLSELNEPVQVTGLTVPVNISAELAAATKAFVSALDTAGDQSQPLFPFRQDDGYIALHSFGRSSNPFQELIPETIARPIEIDIRTRFEHTWICAGSGAGKTQLIQHLISQDFEFVKRNQASLIVIDSQGQMIPLIAGLRAFAPGGAMSGKLVHIDPHDIEYPVALNIFDVGIDRASTYSALDREMLLNSALELLNFILAALGSDMTARQTTLFNYVSRLLLHIPNATINTFRRIMQPNGLDEYKAYVSRLTGVTREFFETEFNSPQYRQTKEQVVSRLFTILDNQAFARMFSHPRSKLNLFTEMNSSKVILIDTAKDLLKQSGAQLFGRFAIAMIGQAIQERAVLLRRGEKLLPCFVYIDEAADYFDATVETILREARKYNVGMCLAHQTLSQLDGNKLRAAFAGNTSIKFMAALGEQETRAAASELRCTPEFIRDQPQLSFATFVRGKTQTAASMRIPYRAIEGMPQMPEGQQEIMRDYRRHAYSSPVSEGPNPEHRHDNDRDGPLDDEPSLDERLARARMDLEKALRSSDWERAAELMHGIIPELERKVATDSVQRATGKTTGDRPQRPRAEPKHHPGSGEGLGRTQNKHEDLASDQY